jgi:DNA-binding XRE family transcriptional regulator
MNQIPKPLKADRQSVTLARKDWKAIVEALEDADDRKSILVSRARRAAGTDDAVPAWIVKRIIAQESPVRVYREWRGLTVTALAKAADVAQPYLSAIEGGSKPGSASALKRIAAALSVDMEDLVRT